MATIQELKNITDEFFSLFWSEKTFGETPQWSKEIWEFNGELPNNENKGCYAHLNGDDVVYIGVAISNSNKGSGIGSRVSNYWKKNPDTFETAKDYISTKEGVTGIITIPFPSKYFYFAAALEVYLILNLQPIKNKTYKYSLNNKK